MIQVFRHGIDITRHQLKGIYVVTVGKARKSTDEERTSSRRHAQVICTLREGPGEDGEDWGVDEDASSSRLKNSPITLTFQGQQTTLRPWDPTRCALSAAIHNRLVHLPVQPKTNVFALCWSLETLSHLSDMVGPTGRLIAVLNKDEPLKPETLHLFLMRHANSTVIFEDIKEASFERYERMLSLPQDSRHAFLMAFHPRLGAKSPARILKPEAEKICKRIFDFLVCGTLGEIKSLVIWHGNRQDVPNGDTNNAFAQAQKHLDILLDWRKASRGEKKSEVELSESKERIWVIMDICGNPTANGELNIELVNEMAKLGLMAKEQLSLTPWFPDRGLLLFQCGLHRDSRKGTPVSLGVGVDELKERRGKEVKERVHRPPSAVAMPVPSFGRAAPEPATAPAWSQDQVPMPPGYSSRVPEEDSDMYAGSSAYPDVSGLRGGPMGGCGFGPPGLGNSMQGMQANQPWMGSQSQESKLLSYLQARAQSGQPSHWPPGLQFQDQAPPPQMPAQWQQAQAMLGPGLGPCLGGKGGRVQWPMSGSQGQSMQGQLPYGFTEDLNFMPLNL